MYMHTQFVPWNITTYANESDIVLLKSASIYIVCIQCVGIHA